MLLLTMDLQSSAEVIGTNPAAFLELVEREGIRGIIRLKDEYRVSIFTLAQILNTTPSALIDLLEDYAFGDLLEEIEDDEQLTGNDAIEAYQHYLSESKN
jgi:hypothetical protein